MPLRRNKIDTITSRQQVGARHYSDECARMSGAFDRGRNAFLRECVVCFKAMPPDIRIAETEATAAAMLQIATLLAEVG